MAYRLLAMDPGSSDVGVAIVDFTDGIPHIAHAQTLQLHKLKRRHKDVAFFHGDHTARCEALYEAMECLTDKYNPNAYGYETQYVGPNGNVGSYESTVKAITYAVQGIRCHHRYIHEYTVSPSAVKKAVGVPGGSKDKEDMRRALDNLALSYSGHVHLHDLSVHAVDAIAIALAIFKLHLGH